MSVPWHLTLESSPCTQLWIPIPLLGQNKRAVSWPVQWTLSNHIDPIPWPNAADWNDTAPELIMISR